MTASAAQDSGVGGHGHVRVAVIGAGFGGIGMGIRLLADGLEDFVILERSDRVGGVWRDNTYPGAACDVPSHLYSFSFDQPSWTRRYSRQAEILGYLEGLVARYGLEAHLRRSSGVERAEWDPVAARWRLDVAGGTSLTADVVVSAVGQLSRPVIPAVAGLETFAGPSWHSARWDHTVDLSGRRVAVVGTGASAVQFVPEIAGTARSLDVYQRSAPYILPKADSHYGGLAGAAYRLPGLSRLDRARIFLTGEALTAAYVGSARMAAQVTRRCRDHLEAQIADPGLRARATPDYQVGCKRIGFSNDWYPTLASGHVELVTEAVTGVTPGGVVTADGTERPADVLIWATGFAANEFLQPMDVVGRAGRHLGEVWRTGAEAFAGVAVAGFPNFFMLYGPNTNLGANSIIYMLETQIAWVATAVGALGANGLAWMDVRDDVQAADAAWTAEASDRTSYRSGCHSWYTDAAGRNTNNWPTYTFRYRRRLRRVDLGDFDVSPALGAAAVAVGR